MTTANSTTQSYLPMVIELESRTHESGKSDVVEEVQSLAGNDTYLICDTKERAGIFYLLPVKKDGQIPKFLCSPIMVSALFRDSNNTGWGRLLTFRDMDDRRHEYILNAADVSKDESALISTLRNEGLMVTTQKQLHHKLVDYLLNTEPRTCRRIRSTGKTGWHTNKLFVTQIESFGTTDEEIIYKGKNAYNTFAVSGTLQEWQNNIGVKCVGNPILSFVVSMAFAPPLIKLLGMENGGFNLMGESSIGKSTALKVATSVFGRPEKGHAIQQWNGTINAIEAIAGAYNDTLLPLDEIGQASGHEIGNTIYMIGNGMGKARMSASTDLRHRQTFRTIVLSTGEKTLDAHMGESGKSARAGQEVRLVDIIADMGMGYGIYSNIQKFENSHDFNEVLLDDSLRYYGSPMKAYLSELVKLPDDVLVKLQEDIVKFINESVSEDSSSQVKRIAGRFALVASAGELASSLGVTGWELGEARRGARILFDRWLEDRGNTGQSEEQKLITQVRRFFEMHGDSRFTPIGPNADSRVINNRVGFRETETVEVHDLETNTTRNEPQHTYFVMAEGFKEICSGFNHKRASQTLLDHNILKPNKDKTAMHSKRLPNIKGPKKVYIFTSAVFEDYEESVNEENHVSPDGTADTQVQSE